MNLHVTTKTHASAFIKLLGCSNERHERRPQAIVRGVWTGASALHAEGVQSRRESESSRRRRQLRRARARRRFLVLVSNQLQVQVVGSFLFNDITGIDLHVSSLRHMNYNVFLFAWRPLLSAHSSLHQPYLAFRPGKALAFLGSHVSRYSSALLESSSKFLKRFSRSSHFERFKSYHHSPTRTPSLSPASSWSHRASVDTSRNLLDLLKPCTPRNIQHARTV